MLRIERTANGARILYQLSGRIEGDDLAELKALIKSEPAGKQIVIDLKDMVLAGLNAVKYFDHVEMRNVELIHAPAYIRTWIERERAGASSARERKSPENQVTGGRR